MKSNVICYWHKTVGTCGWVMCDLILERDVQICVEMHGYNCVPKFVSHSRMETIPQSKAPSCPASSSARSVNKHEKGNRFHSNYRCQSVRATTSSGHFVFVLIRATAAVKICDIIPAIMFRLSEGVILNSVPLNPRLPFSAEVFGNGKRFLRFFFFSFCGNKIGGRLPESNHRYY